MKKKNPHAGSDFDDFLKIEGIYDQVIANALRRSAQDYVNHDHRRSDSQTAAKLLSSRGSSAGKSPERGLSFKTGALQQAGTPAGDAFKVTARQAPPSIRRG